MDLEVGHQCQIRLTCILSTKEFYGFKCDDVKLLEEINSSLSREFSNRNDVDNFGLHESFSLGGKCVCTIKTDDDSTVWRRVVVLHRSASKAVCRQLDYGFAKEYELSALQPFPPITVLSLPPMAYCFSLHGGDKIDSKLFKNYCSLEAGLFYRDFIAIVVRIEKSDALGFPNNYVVTLIDRATRSSVVEELCFEQARVEREEDKTGYQHVRSQSFSGPGHRTRCTSFGSYADLSTNVEVGLQKSVSNGEEKQEFVRNSRSQSFICSSRKRERSKSISRLENALKTSKRLPVSLQRTVSWCDLTKIEKEQPIVCSPPEMQETLLKSILRSKNDLFTTAQVPIKSPFHSTSKEVLNDSPLIKIAGKCRVLSVYSPTELYVRFKNEEEEYAEFKTEMEKTLANLKKNPNRVITFRMTLNPGTVCLFENEQTIASSKGQFERFIEVHRVKVGTISDESECVVKLVDTGDFVNVHISKLWPLLPDAFFEKIINRPRFVRKCSLRWPLTLKPDTDLLITRKIMKEMFRDKTFDYEVRQENDTSIIFLRLSDVEEDMSQLLQQLLLNYEITLREMLEILHLVEWKNLGNKLLEDETPKRILPKIIEFRSFENANKIS